MVKCIDVMIAEASRDSNIYYKTIMAPAPKALSDMKQKIFRDANIELDNMVFQTGKEGRKKHLCVMYDRRNLEEGHGGLPLNEVVNRMMEEMYGDSQKTLYGTVAMFYINEKGTAIIDCVDDAVELSHVIECMKWVLENEDNAQWHSEAFCDAGVGKST